jgi:plasmid segregation protein ParM
MLKCNEAIRRRTGKEIPESMIQQVMLGNVDAVIPKYSAICVDEIKAYVKNLADTLEENKYNTEVLPCVFLGGGATLVKNYGMERFPLSRFINDPKTKMPSIRANAIGYEKLGKNYLRKRGIE